MKVYTKVVMDWDGNVLEEEFYEYEGPVALAGGGGGDTETVQKSEPWEKQKPFLEEIMNEASRLYQQGLPGAYPGDTFANINPWEQLSANMGIGYAGGGMQDVANNTMGANQFLLGDVLKADSNPYMADAARAAITPTFDMLTERALPTIRSGAGMAGQYGGSRQELGEGLAVSRAMRDAMDTTSTMYSDMYGKNLEAMQRGIALAPQTAQLGMMPSQTIGGVGEFLRGFDQAAINDAISKYEYEANAPYENLARYLGFVQGNYGGTGTMSQQGGGQSPVGNILGAASTGLGAYGMMSMVPALGPAAPFVAGGLAIASLFD